MSFKPLQDRILVQRLDATNNAKSGIIIPDTAQEKPQEGMVIAIGRGKLLESGERLPMNIKVGDHVLFATYSGSEIKLGDNDYIIMREEDVLALLESTSSKKSSSKKSSSKKGRKK